MIHIIFYIGMFSGFVVGGATFIIYDYFASRSKKEK